MKLRFSAFIAALALGVPLASHARAATEPEGYVTVRVSDPTPAADKKAATNSPYVTVGRPAAPAAKSWIESRMARDWWKDN